MKRSTVYFAAITLLLTTLILISCESFSSKEKTAEEKSADANQDLEAMKDTVNDEAWSTYKNATETRISDNEARIAALQVKMKSSGKTIDAIRAKRIATLEAKNKELRATLASYEQNQSDWTNFKNTLNHDIDELEKALNELGEDNSK